MIPYVQFLCHLVGDYLLQTNEMAVNKSKSDEWCLLHVCLYTLPFVFVLAVTHTFTVSCLTPLALVMATHFYIDRYSIPRKFFVLRARYFEKDNTPDMLCKYTGISKLRPDSIRWIVYIVTDNTLHLICNYLAFSLFA